jgi:hypothetical protein
MSEKDRVFPYTGYALLIWAVTLISIAVGILFLDEIRAVLAWVIRGLLGGTP